MAENPGSRGVDGGQGRGTREHSTRNARAAHGRRTPHQRNAVRGASSRSTSYPGETLACPGVPSEGVHFPNKPVSWILPLARVGEILPSST